MSRLSMLCPTMGRPTLFRTLASIRAQVRPRDEVLLLHDGSANSLVQDAWTKAALPGRLIENPGPPHEDRGNASRNNAIAHEQVNGDYVMYIDDDAVLGPGALAAIRRAIAVFPGSLYFFRMAYDGENILWKEPRLEVGNVATPMFVHPANLAVGAWQPYVGADHDFIAETVAKHPQRRLLWLPNVVTFVRPVDADSVPFLCPAIQAGSRRYDLGGVGVGGEWITVNRVPPADIIQDIRRLDEFIPFDGEVQAFNLSHTLEHVPATDYVKFLRDLFRKLAPGGTVTISQTDAGAAIRQWVAGKLSFRSMRSVLFPPADRLRSNPLNAHCNMWSAEELAKDLDSVGFVSSTFDAGTWPLDTTDEIAPEAIHQNHGVPIANLGVRGLKPQYKIPNWLHFVFGLKEDFGGKPFGLMHYLAVLSAVMVNRPDRVIIWCAYQPQGEWWDMARGLVEVMKIDPLDWHVGIARPHHANRADVARLMVLLEHGGIYLDMDTVCVRPFAVLRGHSCVMGWEDEGRRHLGNAVIMAEKGSPFVRLQLESQARFVPGMWGEICIVEAGRLATENPQLVHTVPREYFYWPSWTSGGYELMHVDGSTAFCDAYSHHLWEHAYWERGLRDMTVEQLRDGRSNFCRIVTPFVDRLMSLRNGR